LRELQKAEAAAWDAAEYEAQARDEIARLVIRIDNARRQATLYRDQIIPRSETTLSTAETSWQNGKSFFHDVLDSRRLLLDGRTMYVRAVADQYLALSELVLCCGLADLEALELYQNSNP
jgi:cobalt-zinc-cadmium efflux system outer membrane protein